MSSEQGRTESRSSEQGLTESIQRKKRVSKPSVKTQAPATRARPLSLPTGRSTAIRGSASSLPAKKVLSFAAGLQPLIESDPALVKRVRELASAVTMTVLPRTRSGRSIQDHRTRLKEFPSSEFRPDEAALPKACDRLKELGLEILHVGRFGITVRGPARLIAEIGKTNLQVAALPETRKPRSLANFPVSDAGVKPHPNRLFLTPPRSLAIAPAVSETIDHFIFTPPPLYFAKPSALIPQLSYHHLRPADIRRLLQVPDDAPTGAGIRLAIIDSGFYPHPYYQTNGFDIRRIAVPAASPPETDDNGHGTAILFNALATAPQATILGIPQTDPPQVSLEVAFYEQQAQIVSCSWGWDYEQAHSVLELTIRDIVQEGGIVLFAAGNGHYAWPGSMPEVLSIGGVYAEPDGQLQASNFASGYMSSRYPGRRVPDVSGLCGQLPAGVYIPMPTQPGSEMDREHGDRSFDGFDGTGAADGWCVASGTSSATPQVAGIIALLLSAAQARGQSLTAPQIRRILEQTAVSVQTGNNAFGFPAAGHPNVAAGFGLVNTAGALAQIQAAGPHPHGGVPQETGGGQPLPGGPPTDNPVARP